MFIVAESEQEFAIVDSDKSGAGKWGHDIKIRVAEKNADSCVIFSLLWLWCMLVLHPKKGYIAKRPGRGRV